MDTTVDHFQVLKKWLSVYFYSFELVVTLTEHRVHLGCAGQNQLHQRHVV